MRVIGASSVARVSRMWLRLFVCKNRSAMSAPNVYPAPLFDWLNPFRTASGSDHTRSANAPSEGTCNKGGLVQKGCGSSVEIHGKKLCGKCDENDLSGTTSWKRSSITICSTLSTEGDSPACTQNTVSSITALTQRKSKRSVKAVHTLVVPNFRKHLCRIHFVYSRRKRVKRAVRIMRHLRGKSNGEGRGNHSE